MSATEVIVMGGSAGALDALMTVLPGLTVHPVPIVIALHLAPSLPSLLAHLLGRSTPRHTQEIEDKVRMSPYGIYVAPPNYHVLLERDGTIALSVDEPVQFSRPSIDVLFESTAHAFGSRAVGVLLSGGNDDGARGLERIAEEGGVAVVQSPETASQPTMPRAGIARLRGRANAVPVSRIASFLTSLASASYLDQGHAP